jgi:hypothetical protein
MVDTSNLEGEVTITATVTDGRGRTATTSTTVTVIERPVPRISKLTVHRCNAEGIEDIKGEYCLATFSAEVLHALSDTETRYYLQYKKTNESDYTEVPFPDLANVYSVTDKIYLFPADSGSTYDVCLLVALEDTTAEVRTTLSTAFALMHFHKSGTSLGLGCVAEEEETLDVDLFGRFRRKVTFEDVVNINGKLTFNNYVTNMRKMGNVWGKIFDSEDGSIEGIGNVTIHIDLTGTVRFDFSVKIITSGTVGTLKYGLNLDLIRAASTLPLENVKTYSSGTWLCVESDGQTMNYDDSMGFYMYSNGNRWALGVVNYDSSADSTSRRIFYESTFSTGALITGTCYGYFE